MRREIGTLRMHEASIMKARLKENGEKGREMCVCVWECVGLCVRVCVCVCVGVGV
jgi:hypothetical protein